MELSNFSKSRDLFNSQIENLLKKYITSDEIINKVQYSLDGGKRLRPIISLDICNTLCNDKNKALNIALSIELIHTASIILDDMPAMDNDKYRRGKESFHIKYSEKTAQIISTHLIEIAFKLIYDNFSNDIEKMCRMYEIVSNNLGINGIANGQYMDLANIDDNKESFKKKLDKNTLKKLLNQKTTTLFEIAFLGGYLSGSSNSKGVLLIKKASEHFGLAFQIYDDFDDIEQDLKRQYKNIIDPNYVNNLGVKTAYNDFLKHIDDFRKIMTDMNLYSNILEELTNYLVNKVQHKLKNLSIN